MLTIRVSSQRRGASYIRAWRFDPDLEMRK